MDELLINTDVYSGNKYLSMDGIFMWRELVMTTTSTSLKVKLGKWKGPLSSRSAFSPTNSTCSYFIPSLVFLLLDFFYAAFFYSHLIFFKCISPVLVFFFNTVANFSHTVDLETILSCELIFSKISCLTLFDSQQC